jgi:hypothetical protein
MEDSEGAGKKDWRLLSPIENGIVRYLQPESENAIRLSDITKYLNKCEYLDDKGNKITLSQDRTRTMLDHLTKYHHTRAITKGDGDDREEAFYLAKGLGAGARRKMKLQGRGFFYEHSRLLRHLTGVVFLLMGIGLFLYETPNLTGAVIGPSTSGFLVGMLFIFVGLAFFFIKPKKSEKNKKSKKRK